MKKYLVLLTVKREGIINLKDNKNSKSILKLIFITIHLENVTVINNKNS